MRLAIKLYSSFKPVKRSLNMTATISSVHVKNRACFALCSGSQVLFISKIRSYNSIEGRIMHAVMLASEE